LFDKIADDSEDTMCFVGVDLGAFWSLWRWWIQVELRVSVFFTFFWLSKLAKHLSLRKPKI